MSTNDQQFNHDSTLLPYRLRPEGVTLLPDNERSHGGYNG